MVQLVALGAAWGAVYPLTGVALRAGLTPAWVVALRALGAALLLLPYAAVTGALRPALARPATVLLAGLVQATVPLLLITGAQQHVSAGAAGILSTLQPVCAILIIATLSGAMHWLRWAGVVLGAGGAILLAGPIGSGNDPRAAAAVLAAAALFAAGAVFIGHALSDVPARAVAAAAMTVTTVTVLPAAARSPISMPGAAALVALAGLAVLTAVPLGLYYLLVKQLGADRAGLAWYLAPAAALLYDLPVAGAPSATEVLGLLLVIAALAVVSRQGTDPVTVGRH